MVVRKLIIGLICCTVLLSNLNAQDSTKTVKKYLTEGFGISGGLNIGGELYGVSGIENRRSPYSYSINGRVAFNYKNFSMPVSVSYRDAQFSYDYSFNRFSITPTYKWAKVHLGWSNMRFSPYTFSGKSFYGVGAELTPGKFTVGILKGKLQNPLAIRDSLVVGATLIPVYDREIIGAKVGFRDGYNRIEIMATKTADDASSFEMPAQYLDFGYQVFTPKENITLGLNFGVRLFKHIELYANTGASAYTQDISDPTNLEINTTIPPEIADLYTINTSSKLSFAGDGGINLFLKGHRLGLKYRRVEPFYTTLSTNFFMNDVEQYTFNGSTRFYKSKIRMNASVGIERNNLNNYRIYTNNRLILNGDVAIMPSKNWTTNLRFGNYQSESTTQILALNDTLRFVSVNNSYSVFSSYNIKGTNKDINLGFNAFYNTVKDQSETQQIGDVNVLSMGLSPSYILKNINLNLGPTFSYNRYLYGQITQERFSFGGRISKLFLDKKLNTSLNGSLSFNDYNEGNDGKSTFYTLNTNYKITNKNKISFIATYRTINSLLSNNFKEWRTLIRYGVNF